MDCGTKKCKVRGKMGKNGYLEVALEPTSASASGALREVSKKVHEQQANLEVTVQWVGVPFSVPDEKLFSYLQLFSKPVRQKKKF